MLAFASRFYAMEPEASKIKHEIAQKLLDDAIALHKAGKLQEAAENYIKAANIGDREVQFKIGSHLEETSRTMSDPEQAQKQLDVARNFYQMAAKQGHPQAQLRVNASFNFKRPLNPVRPVAKPAPNSNTASNAKAQPKLPAKTVVKQSPKPLPKQAHPKNEQETFMIAANDGQQIKIPQAVAKLSLTLVNICKEAGTRYIGTPIDNKTLCLLAKMMEKVYNIASRGYVQKLSESLDPLVAGKSPTEIIDLFKAAQYLEIESLLKYMTALTVSLLQSSMQIDIIEHYTKAIESFPVNVRTLIFRLLQKEYNKDLLILLDSSDPIEPIRAPDCSAPAATSSSDTKDDERDTKKIKGHPAGISMALYSPDGKYGLMSNKDGSIVFCDRTGKTIKLLKEPSEDIESVIFSPGGRFLALRSKNGTISLWNTQNPADLKKLKLMGHEDEIRVLAFNADGKFVASGSKDKTVRLWYLENLTVKVLAGHEGEIQALAFSPNDKFLASGSKDKTVRLWNLATLKEVKVLAGHEDEIQALAFSNDGKFLASGSKDKTVRLWDLEKDKIIKIFRGNYAIKDVQFSTDGKYLQAVGENDSIFRWYLSMNFSQLVLIIKLLQGVNKSEIFGNPYFAEIIKTGLVKEIIDKLSNEAIVRLLSDRGANVKIASDEVTTLNLSNQLNELPTDLLANAPQLENLTLCKTSLPSNFAQQDVSSGQTIKELRAHTNDVSSVAFSHALTGSNDQKARLWDLARGKAIEELRRHTDSVHSVTFSPDGNYALTGSNDKTIRLWDLATGKIIKELKRDTNSSLAFSPDEFTRTEHAIVEQSTNKKVDESFAQEKQTEVDQNLSEEMGELVIDEESNPASPMNDSSDEKEMKAKESQPRALTAIELLKQQYKQTEETESKKASTEAITKKTVDQMDSLLGLLLLNPITEENKQDQARVLTNAAIDEKKDSAHQTNEDKEKEGKK